MDCPAQSDRRALHAVQKASRPLPLTTHGYGLHPRRARFTTMKALGYFMVGVLIIALIALAGGLDDADARRTPDAQDFIPAGVNCPGHF